MSATASTNNSVTGLVAVAFGIAIVFAVIIMVLSVWGMISSGYSSPILTYFRCTLAQGIATVVFIVAIFIVLGIVLYKYTDAWKQLKDHYDRSDIMNKKALDKCKRDLAEAIVEVKAFEAAAGRVDEF